jgi:hypothetical protein
VLINFKFFKNQSTPFLTSWKKVKGLGASSFQYFGLTKMTLGLVNTDMKCPECEASRHYHLELNAHVRKAPAPFKALMDLMVIYILRFGSGHLFFRKTA